MEDFKTQWGKSNREDFFVSIKSYELKVIQI